MDELDYVIQCWDIALEHYPYSDDDDVEKNRELLRHGFQSGYLYALGYK